MSWHSRPGPVGFCRPMEVGRRLLYAAHFFLGVAGAACLALAIGAECGWMLVRGVFCLVVAILVRWQLRCAGAWDRCAAEGELADDPVATPSD